MKFHTPLKLSLMIAALLVLQPVQAADTLSADAMRSSKAQIDASYTQEKAACDKLKSNAKDVCQEEAKGRERIAHAELNFRNNATADNDYKLRAARAESAYEIALEKCDDWSGNAKDVCVKEAKAVEVKAMADAKLAQTMVDARRDAKADKLDADYKVAAEKCDAMSGDAKSNCMASAKRMHGK